MLRFLSCFSVFFAMLFCVAPLYSGAEPTENPQKPMTRDEKMAALRKRQEWLKARITFEQGEANRLIDLDYFGSRMHQEKADQLQQELDEVNSELGDTPQKKGK